MGTSAGMGLKIKLGKIAPQLSCKFFFSGGLSQVKWQLLWAKQNKAGQKVSKLAKTERLSINLQKYELLPNDRPSQAQLISRTVFVFPLKNRSIAKFLRKLDKLRCLKLSTVLKKRPSFLTPKCNFTKIRWWLFLGSAAPSRHRTRKLPAKTRTSWWSGWLVPLFVLPYKIFIWLNGLPIAIDDRSGTWW